MRPCLCACNLYQLFRLMFQHLSTHHTNNNYSVEVLSEHTITEQYFSWKWLNYEQVKQQGLSQTFIQKAVTTK